MVLSGWEGPQLLPESGRQGEHELFDGISYCSCFCPPHPTFLPACLWVLAASGTAADARGPGAGSGPLLRLRRRLRGRKSGLPLIPRHPGSAAQGAEPHIPADRHQAGEGAHFCTSLCQVWRIGWFFFSTCLGGKGVF